MTDGMGLGTMASDRTGVLIIRAWIEDGSSEPLRAQIRIISDVSAGIERTLTLSRPEAVCATVREWLAEVVGDPEGLGGHSVPGAS